MARSGAAFWFKRPDRGRLADDGRRTTEGVRRDQSTARASPVARQTEHDGGSRSADQRLPGAENQRPGVTAGRLDRDVADRARRRACQSQRRVESQFSVVEIRLWDLSANADGYDPHLLLRR